MISNIVRKLNSSLSFWCENNTQINVKKDAIIQKFVNDNLKKKKIKKKNLV